MALLKIKNVRIAGMSAGVPKNVIKNLELKSISGDYDSAAFVESTGVVERHYSDELTTSDLCIPAAERLIKDLGWDKNEIDAIIFVTQTGDYIIPATACIVQNKLGLSKDCLAEDIGLGCSGWVYGLANIVSIMQNGCIKKALLMAGDAKDQIPRVSPDPLFGHAGTVTALEYKEGETGFAFHLGTDGSGFDAIINLDGGSRNPVSLASFEEEEVDGRMYNRLETRMKGMDVFSFGITTVPKSIKKLSKYIDEDYLNYDYFVFHQANMKMNKLISKKLKLPEGEVPYSMTYYGNTSSASIPLTIITQIKEVKNIKLMCCGFGVGLSWGTVAFKTDNEFITSEIIEI
jgi:3-oxoacyl-[acyl-carrier-protein] synthase-3